MSGQALSSLGQSPTTLVIIDASNVVRSGAGAGNLSRLDTVRDRFEKLGVKCSSIADASLRYYVDDVGLYDKLVGEGKIDQAPAGSCADAFIAGAAMALAEDGTNVYVVTNDVKLSRSEGICGCFKFMFFVNACKELLLLDKSPEHVLQHPRSETR